MWPRGRGGDLGIPPFGSEITYIDDKAYFVIFQQTEVSAKIFLKILRKFSSNYIAELKFSACNMVTRKF